MRTSEKNRFTNALTVGNCKLDMVFTDIFGKSSQSIIETILNNDSFSDKDIISCLHKNCKSSREDILSSVTGISFTHEQKLRIKFVKDHIDYLTNRINELRDIVDTLVVPYEDYITLLMTIPGIDRNTVLNLPFALPPLHEQREIVKKIDEIIPLLNIIENTLKNKETKK